MFDLRSLREKVYDAIKLDILSGRLTQGERMSAADLAERFKVSPQPVRDALIRLTEEGLVNVRPRHGTFVTTISAQRIAELNGTREMIETHSLLHLTEIPDPARLRAIEEALREMTIVTERSNYDYLAYNQWDFQFHLGTVMLANNNTITAMYRKLHPHYLYAMVMYRYATTILGDHEDHRLIVDYIKMNQSDEAAAVASKHVQKANRRLLELMDQDTRVTSNESVVESVDYRSRKKLSERKNF